MTGLDPVSTVSAPSGVREEAVELAALSWFELIGWKTVSGDYLAPDGPMGARSSYKQAVLEPELRSALATLNKDATPTMIDAAVRNVLATPSQDVIENNRAFHPFLASGVPVEINEDGETRTVGCDCSIALTPAPIACLSRTSSSSSARTNATSYAPTWWCLSTGSLSLSWS